ncbi:MAG TPA: ABC transporter permease subunit [Candidatus Latescibacteria bacterium]|nr:ABC transporter permease subunit [Candidatus Latescibacterota bacterium]
MKWYAVLFLPAALLVSFLFLPMARLFLSADPHTLGETLGDPSVLRAIGLTLYASGVSTLIGLITGVPLAYVLSRKEFPLKGLLEGVVRLPLVVPHLAAGVALLLTFGRGFFLGRALGDLGLRFVSSVPGIVIAMLFVSSPLLVISAREAFDKVPARMEGVARTLGASPWRAFWTVSLPLAWRGVVSGCLMMWARGISEFGAIVVLAYHPMVASTLLFERLEGYGLEYAQPVAVILLAVCLGIFLGVQLAAWREHGEG